MMMRDAKPTIRREVRMWIAAVACIAALIRCSSQPPTLAGGTTTETTNGIMACMRTADGSPAAAATVRLRRADYLSPLPSLTKETGIIGADAVTDDSGRFVISGLEAGEYRIEVSDPATRRAVLMACSLDVRDTVDLGSDTLRPVATVKGSVDLASVPGVARFVQIYGLDRLVAVDAAGRYTIGDLPAGLLRLRVAATDTAVKPLTVDSVRTTPGSVTEVPLAGWRFSKRLVLNTTATGANVAEYVLHFPLLVRLDGSAPLTTGALPFDFSQARDSGQDLRFAKPDGTPLPYEIEQWDAANRTAAIWVRMDTVRGNDSTQCIIMTWGNHAASSLSNGAAVFDTADGFAGVWHLGEGVLKAVDRTALANTGTVVGNMNAQSVVDGVSGKALQFNGADYVQIDSPAVSLRFDTAFTIMAWAKMLQKSPYNAWSYIIARPYGAGDADSWALGLFDSAFATIGGIVLQGPVCVPGTWYHLVFVKSGASEQLYIDGLLATSSASAASAVPNDSNGVTIGAERDTNNLVDTYFNGCIDEVRTLDRKIDPAYVRLCYENQRVDQKMVLLP